MKMGSPVRSKHRRGECGEILRLIGRNSDTYVESNNIVIECEEAGKGGAWDTEKGTLPD